MPFLKKEPFFSTACLRCTATQAEWKYGINIVLWTGRSLSVLSNVARLLHGTKSFTTSTDTPHFRFLQLASGSSASGKHVPLIQGFNHPPPPLEHINHYSFTGPLKSNCTGSTGLVTEGNIGRLVMALQGTVGQGWTVHPTQIYRHLLNFPLLHDLTPPSA